MAIFVVLFRGINVGGARRLPMSDVRDACLALGWQRPQTYIQSGNLILDAADRADEVRGRLTARLQMHLGWKPEIIIRTQGEWESHVAVDPFENDPKSEPRMVHLLLSQAPQSSGAVQALQAYAASGERLAWAAGAVWIDFGPLGVHASRLTPAVIDRACGSPTTARNRKTVAALSAMVSARANGSTTGQPGA
jgi:uncharacterized protein (DUF1697 family)